MAVRRALNPEAEDRYLPAQPNLCPVSSMVEHLAYIQKTIVRLCHGVYKFADVVLIVNMLGCGPGEGSAILPVGTSFTPLWANW